MIASIDSTLARSLLQLWFESTLFLRGFHLLPLPPPLPPPLLLLLPLPLRLWFEPTLFLRHLHRQFHRRRARKIGFAHNRFLTCFSGRNPAGSGNDGSGGNVRSGGGGGGGGGDGGSGGGGNLKE